MKSPLLAKISLLFFFALTGKPLMSKAVKPVLDSNGGQVLTGIEYYMVSANQGPGGGGGLNLFNGMNNTCPLLDIIHEEIEMLMGLPLIFSHSRDDEESVVYTSTDVNIKFSETASICKQPTVWKVDDYDNSTGQWFVRTNGVGGNPGAATLESWFKFDMVGLNIYKVSHCPSVCDSCVTLCSNIGVYPRDGVRSLALSHAPLTVQFVRNSV